MIWLTENDGVTNLTLHKVELHGHLLEYREVFDYNSFVEYKLVIFEEIIALLLFVNEKLVLLLLVHH